ncbi:endolytic transglycosylase MltG [Microbulbifer sp. OS29]|uniref:Endolytic murein transglycosylase n=1 Tax=Microbulbifer okhotskensis TaxID=2926617 RepID=A0A9X2J4D7_9GAMM|nr:endolytic transglycosylase MltG [Microbulbifer okhotskensis]MCO1333988.1 endolytic transglycosylase MltG [Microbulbifer okhotskensis]
MKKKQAGSAWKVLKLLFGGFILLCLVAAASLWVVRGALESPLPITQEGLKLQVDKGGSLSRTLRGLQAEGVIQWPRLLLAYAYWEGKTEIHSGEYLVPFGSSARDLVTRLNRGEVTRYRVTLLEGWTFRQALRQIRSGKNIVLSEAGSNVSAVAHALGLKEGEVEGWIFPDTYVYRSGTTDIELLRQAYDRMQKVLGEEWRAKGDDLPYKSPYEALIMASIIEKETGQPSERSEIAGVFVRRLNMGMRLQTDPTVIYGLGDDFDGNLTRTHLRLPTPYNTYVINGLPPTPIALPGRAAIRAALNPKPGKSLYFVGKGDGSHHFSATLMEHNRAVQEYQLKRRADYRSRPTKGNN